MVAIKLLEKTPDTPILYVLDWNHATNILIWHVIYGNSRDDAKLIVDVNGTRESSSGWKSDRSF